MKDEIKNMSPLELFYFCLDYKNPFLTIKEEVIDTYSSFELQYNFTHLSILRELFSYKPSSPYNFLDLGCGIGNTLWIALANSAKKVYGFEISKERVKIGKKILNEPETFLGKKDKEGIFNYLKLHKRLYQPISKYNQMLEDACETLKRSKNLVEIEAADIFSPHISQKIKNKISESDMMYVNIPAIFINFAGKQKLREDRVRTFFSLLNNAKTIIGIVGIQLNEAQWELLEEMPWEPPIFDLKMRIYKRKE